MFAAQSQFQEKTIPFHLCFKVLKQAAVEGGFSITCSPNQNSQELLFESAEGASILAKLSKKFLLNVRGQGKHFSMSGCPESDH